MAILHYQVSQLDHSWLVTCEDVPVEAFDTRKEAVDAAVKLVGAAKMRGDRPILRIKHARVAPRYSRPASSSSSTALSPSSR